LKFKFKIEQDIIINEVNFNESIKELRETVFTIYNSFFKNFTHIENFKQICEKINVFSLLE